MAAYLQRDGTPYASFSKREYLLLLTFHSLLLELCHPHPPDMSLSRQIKFPHDTLLSERLLSNSATSDPFLWEKGVIQVMVKEFGGQMKRRAAIRMFVDMTLYELPGTKDLKPEMIQAMTDNLVLALEQSAEKE